MANFQWGAGGQIVTPEQAKRQRAIAEALLAQTDTPAKNWAQGIADVAGALSGTVINNRVNDAEAAGYEQAGGLFGGLSSASPEADIIGALNNPWLNENQSAVARSLLGSRLEQMDPMYQAKLAQLQAGDAGSETYYGTPLYTEDASGNLIANQLGNQGTFNPIELPEGQRLAPPTKEVDTGTEIITLDRFGNELFRTPKQNQQAAFDTATGTGLGKANAENIAAFESMNSKLPGLKTVVDELNDLSEIATYTAAGQALDTVRRETGMPTSEGALARTKYIAMVDNQVLPLLRDTFGAAFTVKEGESLRATLGDPNKSPKEKQAVLEAFIEQKVRDVQAMENRIPKATGTTSSGLTWSVVP